MKIFKLKKYIEKTFIYIIYIKNKNI